MTASQDRLNSQGKSTIKDFVGDVVSVETGIEETLDRQLKMGQDNAVFSAAVQRFHDAVKASRDAARSYRDAIGGDSEGANALVEKGTGALGALTGMIQKLRPEGLTKAMRDDYVLFNTAAIAYTTLHTTAMALGDTETEALAAQGLRTYAKLVQDINNIVPDLVVNELQNDNHVIVNPMAADQCRQEIDRIWKATS
jgi:ferritin-like metal-binding protein YciE